MYCMTGQWKTPGTIWAKIISAAVLIVIALAPGPLAASTGPPVKALILYETETRADEIYPLADALEECLGHFNIQADKMLRAGWRPGGLSGYGLVFYIGTGKAVLPLELLEEIARTPRLVWIEGNIEQYAMFKGWRDFKSQGEKGQFASLLYKGRSLPYPVDIPIHIAYPESGAEVVASADNLDKPLPYIWRKENVWYIGRMNITGSAFLIMADVLHDICGEDHPASRTARIRIEDVNPSTPPEKLAALIDVLSEKRVPYSVGVIPAYVYKGEIITLNDVPALVQVLRRVEETGGSIIQHGYTHQNEFSPITGEGFEFWNARDDSPLPVDGEEYVSPRVNSGLDILARAGIYPVAFEAPHFAVSQMGYQALARHFNLLSGQVQLSDHSHTIAFQAPYIFKSNRAGMTVDPDNLGYYDPDEVNSLGKILTLAEQYAIVRDCQIGIFFHNYLPPQELAEIIDGLKKLGYGFFDYHSFGYRVEGENVNIVNINGHRQVSTAITPVFDKKLSGARLFLKKWMSSLSGLLVIIVLSYVFIILTVRKNKKRLYEAE